MSGDPTRTARCTALSHSPKWDRNPTLLTCARRSARHEIDNIIAKPERVAEDLELAKVGYLAIKSTNNVTAIERGLVACAFGGKVKDAVTVVEDGFRSPARPNDV